MLNELFAIFFHHACLVLYILYCEEEIIFFAILFFLMGDAMTGNVRSHVMLNATSAIVIQYKLEGRRWYSLRWKNRSDYMCVMCDLKSGILIDYTYAPKAHLCSLGIL